MFKCQVTLSLFKEKFETEIQKVEKHLAPTSQLHLARAT